jgi:hypothetical protein
VYLVCSVACRVLANGGQWALSTNDISYYASPCIAKQAQGNAFEVPRDGQFWVSHALELLYMCSGFRV